MKEKILKNCFFYYEKEYKKRLLEICGRNDYFDKNLQRDFLKNILGKKLGRCLFLMDKIGFKNEK